MNPHGNGWAQTDLAGEDWDCAMAQARGCYQRALLYGWEAVSGSTLRGKAKRYGAHYQRSARSLIARLEAAGFAVRIVRVNRRNVLEFTKGSGDAR